ncbi:MAG TPA: hypothetical protein VGO49_23915 [Bradyrhizobium sp.]|jgi:hypothetical protein|nr:hypothetical protein [Bradyrhizobium sp.]
MTVEFFAAAASNKIEFSYLNGNLMVPKLHLHSLALTAILVKADKVHPFVSSHA